MRPGMPHQCLKTIAHAPEYQQRQFSMTSVGSMLEPDACACENQYILPETLMLAGENQCIPLPALIVGVAMAAMAI